MNVKNQKQKIIKIKAHVRQPKNNNAYPSFDNYKPIFGIEVARRMLKHSKDSLN